MQSSPIVKSFFFAEKKGGKEPAALNSGVKPIGNKTGLEIPKGQTKRIDLGKGDITTNNFENQGNGEQNNESSNIFRPKSGVGSELRRVKM